MSVVAERKLLLFKIVFGENLTKKFFTIQLKIYITRALIYFIYFSQALSFKFHKIFVLLYYYL